MATANEDVSFFSLVREALNEAAVAALNRIGTEAAEKMKNALADNQPYPAIYKGNLTDSITMAMKGAKTHKYFPADEIRPGNPNMGLVGGRAKRENVISPETRKLTVKIGTADKTGKYMNYGTGPHKTNQDSEGFVESIREWCRFKGFDDDFANYLIQKIRKRGTFAVPFIDIAKEYVDAIKGVYLRESINKLLRKIPKVKRVISEKSIKVTILRSGA